MKILYYIYGLNVGGAETYIYNVLQKIDFERYHIDFVIQETNNGNDNLVNLCKKIGAEIHCIPKFYKRPFSSYKALKKILLSNEYDAIHVHCNSLLNFSPILCAQTMDIPVIVHSHNTSSKLGRVGNIFHYINRGLMMNNVIRVACGKNAGEWMFGNKDFLILNNGIMIDKFAFSSEKRERIRTLYKIPSEKKIIGHIGRFVPEKNHRFVIDVVKQLNKIHNNYILMMVGDGPLKDSCMEYAKESLTDECVIFTGNVNNPEEYYSAFDCMLFPSLYEGVPFTLVEAQASGLPIISSSNVTKVVNITNCVEFLPIHKSIDLWIGRTMSILSGNTDRINNSEKMNGSDYDIRVTIKKLTDIYDKIMLRM